MTRGYRSGILSGLRPKVTLSIFLILPVPHRCSRRSEFAAVFSALKSVRRSGFGGAKAPAKRAKDLWVFGSAPHSNLAFPFASFRAAVNVERRTLNAERRTVNGER